MKLKKRYIIPFVLFFAASCTTLYAFNKAFCSASRRLTSTTTSLFSKRQHLLPCISHPYTQLPMLGVCAENQIVPFITTHTESPVGSFYQKFKFKSGSFSGYHKGLIACSLGLSSMWMWHASAEWLDFEEVNVHHAARWGHLAEVKRLIKEGTNVHAKDNDGYTPLHWAKSEGIARFLIENGANLRATTNYGKTPLHTASYWGQVAVVKVLIAKGADLNAQDNYGRTPLHTASCYGQVDVVKVLIAKGVDLNAQDNHGYTPLHIASLLGRVEVAKVLIAKGADLNAQNNHGYTPLHTASSCGHIDVAKVLIENGANKNATTSWFFGSTVLDLAERHNNQAMINYLKSIGAK